MAAKKKKNKKNKVGNQQQQGGGKTIEGYDSWGPEQLAEYFGTVGLGDYYEPVVKHKLTGKLAPLVTDQDLKDMGIKVVGDRLRFRQVIKSFARKARIQERTKVLWKGEERLYWSWFDWCLETGCGCCPTNPSTYKLSSNHLKARVAEPGRCGPVKLCCCYSYATNNVDLSQVSDVDVQGVPAPWAKRVFCCAYGKDVISVSFDRDKILLMPLKSGLGEKVSSLIMNQIEEAQVMERD
jgi:hypothetical protein